MYSDDSFYVSIVLVCLMVYKKLHDFNLAEYLMMEEEKQSNITCIV